MNCELPATSRPLRSRIRRCATLLLLLVCPLPDVFAQEKAEEGAAEQAPTSFRVLKSHSINLGNRSLIINRVVPPVLPEPPTKPVPPTAEQIAAAEAADAAEALRHPPKKYEVLFLFTTVYDRKVTEIRGFGGKGEFRLFSNIDFNYLAGMGSFETQDTAYTLLMGVDNETAEEAAAFNQYAAEQGWPKQYWKQIPPLETFNKTRSEYAALEGDARTLPSEEDLTALDALHVYYDANTQWLIEEYHKREAANAERARRLKEHPPVPKDTIINFWLEESNNPSNRSKMEVAQ